MALAKYFVGPNKKVAVEAAVIGDTATAGAATVVVFEATGVITEVLYVIVSQNQIVADAISTDEMLFDISSDDQGNYAIRNQVIPILEQGPFSIVFDDKNAPRLDGLEISVRNNDATDNEFWYTVGYRIII